MENKISYGEWLLKTNPKGGNPDKAGTSNYNYLIRSKKFPEKSAPELFKLYKKEKSSFLKKYIDYKVFVEDTGSYVDFGMTLCEVFDAINKAFSVNDKYKVYNALTSALLPGNDELNLRKGNVKSLIVPPAADEENEYGFYRFMMLHNIRQRFDDVRKRVESFLISLCEDVFFDLRDNAANAAGLCLESHEVCGRAEELLHILSGLSSTWYDYFSEQEITTFICGHIVRLFSAALGDESLLSDIRDESEDDRRALSVLLPLFRNLNAELVRAVSESNEDEYIRTLLLSGLVYVRLNGDEDGELRVCEGLRDSLPDIPRNADGLDLCRLIRSDKHAVRMLGNLTEALFKSQVRAFRASEFVFDPALFVLSDELSVLTAAMTEHPSSDPDDARLSENLVRVFTLAHTARLYRDEKATRRGKLNCAIALTGLYNLRRSSVISALKLADSFSGETVLCINWYILASETALDICREEKDSSVISQALLCAETARSLSLANGDAVCAVRAMVTCARVIAQNAALNAADCPQAELAAYDFFPCVRLISDCMNIIEALPHDEKERCMTAFTNGIKKFTGFLMSDGAELRKLLLSDPLGSKIFSGADASFDEMKLGLSERIIPKELTPGLSERLLASPLLIAPQQLDSSLFLRPFYMSALDSERCAQLGCTAADIESQIFKKLLSGQRVLLTVNQLCDNARVLQLAEKKWFLDLLRSGDIILSYYRSYSNLTEFAREQLSGGGYKWSSMPFLDNSDRRHEAINILRGLPFDSSVFERPEHAAILRRFRNRLSLIDLTVSAQSICRYFQRPGVIDIFALLKQNLKSFYKNRAGNISFIHNKIDESIDAEIRASSDTLKYTRTAYIERLDRLENSQLDIFSLSPAERDRLERLAGGEDMRNVRDTLNDQYSFILGSMSSKFQEHRYTSSLLVPEREDETFTYRDITRVTEAGAAIDGEALVEYMKELRAKIFEKNQRAERLASSLNRSWESAGITFGIDDLCGEFCVDSASVKTTEHETLNIKNTKENELHDAIHLQVGS